MRFGKYGAILLIALGMSSSALMAQALMPTYVSTAPYYFQGNYFPQYQPNFFNYQLPQYWQQQQPNFMMMAMPGIMNSFSMMLDNDISRSRDRFDFDYDDDEDSSRRGRRGRYSTRRDFLYERGSESQRRGESQVVSAVPSRPVETAVRVQPSRAAEEECESCFVEDNSSPVSPALRTTIDDSTDAAERVSEGAYAEYSNSSRVARMLSSLERRSRRHLNSARRDIGSKSPERSVGRCLMYVKFAMRDAGYFSSYPEGVGSAKNFGPTLQRAGFTNIMQSSSVAAARNAPIGAVLVYEGDEHGHIEIKTGESEYTSDYVTSRPRNIDPSRRLIGIYVKTEGN